MESIIVPTGVVETEAPMAKLSELAAKLVAISPK